MKKTGEQIPIMGYVQELEGKVREAREESKRYRRMALMVLIRKFQFWTGMIIGGMIVGVWGLVIWGLWEIGKMLVRR
jgi:hypothetical protein